MKKLTLMVCVLALGLQPAAARAESFADVSKQVNKRMVKLFGSGGFKGLVAYGSGVLVSSKGAYYHSAGSSPDGMSTGSSPFLVAEVIAWLQAEGKTTFNLGGATAAEEGLHRFKRGFGSVEVPLEAATCDLSPSVVRMLRRLLRR